MKKRNPKRCMMEAFRESIDNAVLRELSRRSEGTPGEGATPRCGVAVGSIPAVPSIPEPILGNWDSEPYPGADMTGGLLIGNALRIPDKED